MLNHFERIADALERIAAAMEAQATNPAHRAQPPAGSGQQRHITDAQSRAGHILNLLESHRDKLRGRMTAQQIANIIDFTMRHSDRVAFGTAMNEFGATRIKSGGMVYYGFGSNTAEFDIKRLPDHAQELFAKHIETLRRESPLDINRIVEIVGAKPSNAPHIATDLAPLEIRDDDGMYRF